MKSIQVTARITFPEKLDLPFYNFVIVTECDSIGSTSANHIAHLFLKEFKKYFSETDFSVLRNICFKELVAFISIKLVENKKEIEGEDIRWSTSQALEQYLNEMRIPAD